MTTAVKSCRIFHTSLIANFFTSVTDFFVSLIRFSVIEKLLFQLLCQFVKYFRSETFFIFICKHITFHYRRGQKVIFNKKVIEILKGNKKGCSRTELRRVTSKLRKQERLTDSEFWMVYKTIWQERPEAKYSAQTKWLNP